jgi:hypothetical protein
MKIIKTIISIFILLSLSACRVVQDSMVMCAYNNAQENAPQEKQQHLRDLKDSYFEKQNN